MKKSIQKSFYGWLFLSPYLILVVLFFIVPLVFAIYFSFTRYSLIWGGIENANFIGLKNFKNLLHDKLFLISLKNTLTFVLLSLPTQLVISFSLAYILNSTRLSNKGFYRTLFYIPTLTSTVAITLIFTYLFQSKGLINMVISVFYPLDLNWLDSLKHIKFPVITMYSWIKVGVYMLIYLSGFMGIPKSFYETLKLEGGNLYHKLRLIIIPTLRNVTYFISTMILIDSFKLFDIPFILSRGTGGPLNSTLTTVIYIYKTAFTSGRMGYASATSLLLFLIIFVFAKVQSYLKGRLL
ncbi:MAG: sugar ABC transporter permease [Spirochaetaceae bacterium]